MILVRHISKQFLKKCSHGQALIEFAIVIFFLTLLLCGLIDFSRILYARNLIMHLSREGANMVARGTPALTAMPIIFDSALPLDLNTNGCVIISLVNRQAAPANQVAAPDDGLVLAAQDMQGNRCGSVNTLVNTNVINGTATLRLINFPPQFVIFPGGIINKNPSTFPVFPHIGQSVYVVEVFYFPQLFFPMIEEYFAGPISDATVF